MYNMHGRFYIVGTSPMPAMYARVSQRLHCQMARDGKLDLSAWFHLHVTTNVFHVF